MLVLALMLLRRELIIKMLSAGNDIVDLNLIDVKKTKDFRFYSKILCLSEQALYETLDNKINFEHYVWLLWSIKESAYKYFKRYTPNLIFSPTKISINQINIPSKLILNKIFYEEEGNSFKNETSLKCRVSFENQIIYSISFINNFFIASFVNTDQCFENTLWGIKQINQTTPDFQSNAVREFVLKRINFIFPSDIFSIKKHLAGYPYLLKNNVEINLPLSLSHHGSYICYALEIL